MTEDDRKMDEKENAKTGRFCFIKIRAFFSIICKMCSIAFRAFGWYTYKKKYEKRSFFQIIKGRLRISEK